MGGGGIVDGVTRPIAGSAARVNHPGLNASSSIGEAPYQAALEFLFQRTTGGVKFGPDRMHALLARLGDPHRAVPAFHVAGTNGKGSTVATLSALLRARGLRVGAYTSPHLVDFRERIAVDGVEISAAEIVSFVDREMPFIESVGATFFEATTALAFDYLARAGADVMFIETGLGGRLDATNVLPRPLAAAVTSIGWDHTEYLGHSLAEIAREKAGIFKAGCPAVLGPMDPDIRDLIVREAERAGASDIEVVNERIDLDEIEVTADGTRAAWRLRAVETGRAVLQTPLTGRHQAANAMIAWLMADLAGAPYRATLSEFAAALPHVALGGRFQRRGPFIFDVAHRSEER